MEELILELKEEIIDALNLEEVTPADIDNDAPLFGEGFGLELIVLLEKKYGIRLSNPQEGKEVFKSVAVMAGYVKDNRKK